ncbi:MAG: CHAD domain-containing protein [Chloroflexi bacterium]|nr:CHAD domain-containing protein [Chloroflexota bacterium]
MAPARPVRGLTCEESFRTAAGKIIWTRFEEMMAFREAALAGEDPEGVHDMRVASRRLRAAIELFHDVFPRRRLRPMLRSVKDLADALGQVRDLDVMLERLQADRAGRPAGQRLVLTDMVADLERKRREARRALVETVETLEREDFPRRFVALVARETT